MWLRRCLVILLQNLISLASLVSQRSRPAFANAQNPRAKACLLAACLFLPGRRSLFFKPDTKPGKKTKASYGGPASRMGAAGWRTKPRSSGRQIVQPSHIAFRLAEKTINAKPSAQSHHLCFSLPIKPPAQSVLILPSQPRNRLSPPVWHPFDRQEKEIASMIFLS